MCRCGNDQCDPCARNFAYAYWGIDAHYQRHLQAEPEPPLTTRNGYWYPDPVDVEVYVEQTTAPPNT